MTLFEYLSVAVSIVLALGVAHLLGNIRQILDPKLRYWVHCLWAAQLLLIYALQWWSLWAFRDAEWNFAHFMLVLSGPGLLYVCSTILVTDAPKGDWRSHYYAIHRWLFVALLALLVQTNLTFWVLGDILLFTPSRPMWFVLALFAGVAAMTRRPEVHAGIALANAVLFVYLSVDLLRPEDVL